MKYHYKKQAIKRISSASQFTIPIPNGAAVTPDRAGNNTDTRSSNLTEGIHTPDF